jgi:hypothetical protein
MPKHPNDYLSPSQHVPDHAYQIDVSRFDPVVAEALNAMAIDFHYTEAICDRATRILRRREVVAKRMATRLATRPANRVRTKGEKIEETRAAAVVGCGEGPNRESEPSHQLVRTVPTVQALVVILG